MTELFNTERSVITKHLKNIFESGEMDQHSACAKFAYAVADGKNYNTQFYNLDAIIYATNVDYNKDAPIAREFFAKDRTKGEFEKQRIIQDRFFESNFNKQVKTIKRQMAKIKNGSKNG